jgi:thiamine-monophosphate kinase
MVVDITLLGTVPRHEVVLRSGAKVGDLLVVSGRLGSAAAARLVRARPGAFEASLRRFAQENTVPVPRVRLGRSLAVSGRVHAMIDISDGLASDVRHLAAAGSVGVRLDESLLPIAPETRLIAAAEDTPATDFALSGGEDYELLFAIAPDDFAALLEQALAAEITAVGHVVPASAGNTLETLAGTIVPLDAAGWTHF